MSYLYFSHEIDGETSFCVGCGQFLMDLQENRKWVGDEVFPKCVEASNVSAISHLVRSHRTNVAEDGRVRPRPYRR
jgi:hypothetical protein